MKSIFKYPLAVTDYQVLKLPLESKLLCVQVQIRIPCLWAMVDKNQDEHESIVIRTIGTGHDIREYPGEYLGTYQIEGGALVFHVFASVSK